MNDKVKTKAVAVGEEIKYSASLLMQPPVLLVLAFVVILVLLAGLSA